MKSITYTDVFKIQYNMLTTIGAWPEDNAPLRYKLKELIYFLFTIALEVTMLMEAFADITDFAKLSEILYIMVTITVYLFKHATVFFQRKTFIYMINLLKDPIFTTYPGDLDVLLIRRIKTSRILTNFYRYLILLCIILMTISPFLDNRPLPFPFPYDTGKYRYVMYVFQIWAVSVVGWTHSSLDTLSANLIGLAATYLQILGIKITRIREDSLILTENDERKFSIEMNVKVIKVLKQCSQHHLAIIEYISCIEKVFSFCILMQFLSSVIIICNTLFHFVLIQIGSAQFFMLLNYFIFSIYQLLMYCWFGNEVIWMSLRVGEACYLSNWYNCSNDVRKYLFIIMERSKRPLKITVFKFSVLSLRSFTTIIQWSYSYFALLFKLYKNSSS